MRAGLAIAILVSMSIGFGGGGCGDGGAENPPVLWLALDGSETQVRLIEQEPPYF